MYEGPGNLSSTEYRLLVSDVNDIRRDRVQQWMMGVSVRVPGPKYAASVDKTEERAQLHRVPLPSTSGNWSKIPEQGTPLPTAAIRAERSAD